MATLYTGASSVTDGPMVYHTVTYTVARSGMTITFNFHIDSWLERPTSWIGAGKSITFKATCVHNGVTYTSTLDAYKYLHYYWCASSSVPDYELKDPKQVGHLTADISLVVPNVGAIATLTVTTETIRSDGDIKPGAHSRTNSIPIPAAVAPAVPSLVVTKPNATNYFKSGDPFVLSPVNNGTGSGTFLRWHYQFQRNAEPWTACGGTPTSASPFTDYPSGSALPAGSTMKYRVGIESTTGQITYSAASATYTVAAVPAKMAQPTADKAVVVNPTDTLRYSFAALNPAPDSGVAYYRIAIYKSDGTWAYSNQAELYIDVKPSDYGWGRGQSIQFTVVTVSVVGLSSPWADVKSVPVAKLPDNVASLTPASYSPILVGNVVLNWPAAAIGTGAITNYEIEYAFMNPGGAWSAWNALATVGAVTTLTKPLSEHTDYASFMPNTQLKYRIRSKDEYALYSAAYTETTILTILGGLMNKKIAGHYQQGLSYIKLAGHWNLVIEVYKKIAGHWHMGVG
jgi:hypothetical protein